MLNFYDVDPKYANYLRQFDRRVPDIVYSSNNKFVCGIVLSINGYHYFAPISSNTSKQQTNILIKDNKGRVLSSIKFSFMFPAPDSVIKLKDFNDIRKTDFAYASLLEMEHKFCIENEQAICDKAARIYKVGCDPNHALHQYCCNFPLLEVKCSEWNASSKP